MTKLFAALTVFLFATGLQACAPPEPTDPGGGRMIEVSSQAISNGVVGGSSLSLNYDCFGTICTCDGTLDCRKLFFSSECGGKDLRCEWSPELRRSICSCVIGPSCTPWNGPNHCPIASMLPQTGVWKYDNGYHYRQDSGGRVCTLLGGQCDAACKAAAMTPSADLLARLRATDSLQNCTGVEAGVVPNDKADGYYRVPSTGGIYKKIGKRACYASGDFYYNKDGAQPFFNMPSFSFEADFWIRYADNTGAVLWCNDADIKTF